MSHELETMAYAGEVPWHGLGEKVSQDLSVQEMMEAAKLDWSVSQHPMVAQVGEVDVASDKLALVRDSDNSILTITSERWKPTQNHEAFEFFREFCEVGGATMETAGSLKNGRHVWAMAKLNEGFTVNDGDRTEGYLLFSLPHELGKSIQVRTTSVRVVCNNTLTWSLEGGTTSEFRQSHTKAFDFDAAKNVVEMACDRLINQAKFSQRLADVEMDSLSAVSFFHELLTDEALEKAEAEGIMEGLYSPMGKRSKIGKLINSYQNGPGADTESAWGVLNGVTHFCDHTSGLDQDKRLWDSWWGSNYQLKNKAVAMLDKVAA